MSTFIYPDEYKPIVSDPYPGVSGLKIVLVDIDPDEFKIVPINWEDFKPTSENFKNPHASAKRDNDEKNLVVYAGPYNRPKGDGYMKFDGPLFTSIRGCDNIAYCVQIEDGSFTVTFATTEFFLHPLTALSKVQWYGL